MREFCKKILPVLLVVLISFRDILAFYTTEYIKIIPDVIIIIFFLITIIKKRNGLIVSKSDKILFCLLSIGVFSTVINEVNFLNFIYQIRSISIIYLLYFAVKNTNINIPYKRITYTLCFISIFFTVLAVIEIASQKTMLFPAEWAKGITYSSNFKRAYSLLGNPNTFAAFTTLSFILLNLQSTKNRFGKNLNRTMFFATILAIILSASRSGAIIFSIYLLYKIISPRKNHLKRYLKPTPLLISGGIIAVVVLIIASITIGVTTSEESATASNLPIIGRTIDFFSGRTFETNAVDGRIYKINKAIEAFQDDPIIGSGLGTFGSSGSTRTVPMRYQKYNLSSDFYADNQYIVVLVETGLLGATLFVFFFFYFIKENKTSRGLAPIMIIIAVLGLFYNIIEVLPLMFISLIIISSTKPRSETTA